jgi:hypothetical protein
MPMPANIPAAITVVPLDDPVVERHGYGPNSSYVSACYLPTLGPTSLWLYRRVGVMVLTADQTVVELAELGRELGVGAGTGTGTAPWSEPCDASRCSASHSGTARPTRSAGTSRR